MEDCEKYLGLPMVGRKSKVNTFRELWEKITNKVLGWKEKYISEAGRKILIKTVAQVIPTYSMSIFKIPRALCDAINSIVAKYWWGQSKDEKKIHLINWKKLCTRKERSGMGFRDIQAFNLAMLAKQAWRLIHNIHSLFYRVYKSRYFPNCSFMDAETGSNPSYNWRSLWAARVVMKEGSKWQVGDGSNIEVSNHKWLTHKPVFLGDTRPNLLVKDLIDSTTRPWDREKIFDQFAHKTRILQLPLTRLYSQDRPVSKENRPQKFSVKSAYQVAQG